MRDVDAKRKCNKYT